eukprot:10689799-Prorocentrum_lima.AAC.1
MDWCMRGQHARMRGHDVQLWRDSNALRFHEYRVRDNWIEALVQAGKIELDVTKALYTAFGNS